MFRRGYYFIYQRMKGKHLYRYPNEFTGRAEIQSMDTMAQMEYMVSRMVGTTLTYTRLTA